MPTHCKNQRQTGTFHSAPRDKHRYFISVTRTSLMPLIFGLCGEESLVQSIDIRCLKSSSQGIRHEDTRVINEWDEDGNAKPSFLTVCSILVSIPFQISSYL